MCVEGRGRGGLPVYVLEGGVKVYVLEGGVKIC